MKNKSASKKNTGFRKRITVLLLATVSSVGFSMDEIPVGSVIDASNLDTFRDKTFEGKKIDDLLLPVQQKLVKEYGVTYKIRKSEPINVGENLIEYTKKYADQVSLDPNTLELKGFVTGTPFPKITEDDPQAGMKLMYNFLRTPWTGDTAEFNPMSLLAVDGKKGLERENRALVNKILLQGRLSEPHLLSKEEIYVNTMIFLYPNDARGVGLLTISYADGRLPDVYAYIKPVRRVRRLSSGSWADPLSGSDLLGDEQQGQSGDPRWYKSVKLLNKRYMLAAAHSVTPGMDAAQSDPAKRYNLRLNEPPYWDYDDEFEPREVWAVEVINQPQHIAGKKILYFDTNPYISFPWFWESYDKKGALWRILEQGIYEVKSSKGNLTYGPGPMRVVDLQRRHATVVPSSRGIVQFDIDKGREDFTPQALSRLLQ